jgi:hypothetical protein
MAIANFVYTTSAKLNKLPVEDGQIIFAPDMNTICLDMSGNRFYYQTIKTFETDEQRAATPFPIQGFYFVEETQVIWRWCGKWIQITADPNPIVGGETEEDFPEQGKKNSLYYTDDGIFS